MNMREKVRDWEVLWDLQSEAEHVLIRFGIAIRFTKLVKNPLHTRPYNFKTQLAAKSRQNRRRRGRWRGGRRGRIGV
jgi:hypothetical protein